VITIDAFHVAGRFTSYYFYFSWEALATSYQLHLTNYISPTAFSYEEPPATDYLSPLTSHALLRGATDY